MNYLEHFLSMSGSFKMERQDQTLKYLDELKDYLDHTNLSQEDICLVGSAILADYGLRVNRDLDIAIDPFERGKIEFDNVPDELEISLEKYSWLSVTDRDLIHDERYHYRSQGFKIIRPEIELSFKHRRLWNKDEKDIELLEDRFLDAEDYDWDWERFSYEFYPEKFGKRGLPESTRQDSLIVQFERKLRQDGLLETLRSTLEYSTEKLPRLNQSSQSVDNSSGPATSSDQTLYFIAWPTASEFFDVLVTRLDTELGVVSTETIELANEMDQFVKDVYGFNTDGDERLIEHKSYKISNDGIKVLLIETQCPVTTSGELDEQFLSSFKNHIRKQYYPYVSDDSFHNIMHGPDTLDENKWIKHILRSYTKDGITN